MRVGGCGAKADGADFVACVGVGVCEDVGAACGWAIGAPVDRATPDPGRTNRYRAHSRMFREADQTGKGLMHDLARLFGA